MEDLSKEKWIMKGKWFVTWIEMQFKTVSSAICRANPTDFNVETANIIYSK